MTFVLSYIQVECITVRCPFNNLMSRVLTFPCDVYLDNVVNYSDVALHTFILFRILMKKINTEFEELMLTKTEGKMIEQLTVRPCSCRKVHV